MTIWSAATSMARAITVFLENKEAMKKTQRYKKISEYIYQERHP